MPLWIDDHHLKVEFIYLLTITGCNVCYAILLFSPNLTYDTPGNFSLPAILALSYMVVFCLNFFVGLMVVVFAGSFPYAYFLPSTNS